MPSFYIDEKKITPSEFIQNCSQREIKELIETLKDEGYIHNQVVLSNSQPISLPERIFEEYLMAIHGNWNILSSEEEETIMKIGSRFK